MVLTFQIKFLRKVYIDLKMKELNYLLSCLSLWVYLSCFCHYSSSGNMVKSWKVSFSYSQVLMLFSSWKGKQGDFVEKTVLFCFVFFILCSELILNSGITPGRTQGTFCDARNITSAACKTIIIVLSLQSKNSVLKIRMKETIVSLNLQQKTCNK